MSNRLTKNISALLILLVTFGLIDWVWFKQFSLFGLLIVSLLSTWAIAKAQQPDPDWPWPLPNPPQPQPAIETSSLPSRGRLVFIALGLVLLTFAYSALHTNSPLTALALIFATALCWRPLLKLNATKVPAKWIASLTLLILAVAALFRLYKAGSVPIGLIHYDESLVYSIAREVVLGSRQIFNFKGNDGQFPYWADAATLSLFGDSIFGFRMSSILSGFAVVGFICLLGKELVGSRVALIAGAFTSMSLWPVTFSRAEYLVSSSYLPVLACVWLVLLGLRLGSPLALAFAGLSFGASLSVYNGAKILPLIIPLLVCMIWFHQKDWRRPLAWAWVPFASGVIIAIAPLILWAWHDPTGAHNAYFGKLNDDWIAGPDVVAVQGTFARLNILVGRILPNFNRVIVMFTTIGDGPSYCYFLSNQTFIDKALLFLLLPGMATCVARFRKPPYALILCWWFLSFMPALMATTQYWPSSRRIMINMPATMFMASVGFLTLFELFAAELKATLNNRLLLLVSLSFFAWYAMTSWHTYFEVLNKDITYLAWTQANFVNGIRATKEEDAKSPVYLINFRKPNADNWLVPDFFIVHKHHNAFLDMVPQTMCQLEGGYFSKGGLFGALENMPLEFPDKKKRDPLIVLTPFHFYLEPFLLALGGERVQEIMPAESSTGTSWADFGFAPHKGAAHRMIRIKNYDRSKLAALKERWGYTYTTEELIPPAAFGTREALAAKYYNSPEMLAALRDYEAHPKRWRATAKQQFTLPDVFFWTTVNYLSKAPMRLTANWILNIPQDGLYSLGAAATLYTSLYVDGKKVFRLCGPENPQVLLASMDGSLGEPVFLKAGPHRLDVEQINFTWNPIVTQAIRLIWKKPGGESETLPLDVLLPDPSKKLSPLPLGATR